MITIGKMRFLDALGTERGRLEVIVEGDTITLISERDGRPHRLHIAASTAEKLAAHLDRAAETARGIALP